jgi:antitoxin component YwqK of YwqJK toxin-antitoxin module
MKYLPMLLGALALMTTACDQSKKDNGVVSERYIHKYGYAVSKDEFQERQYPGQSIVLLKNGVTITATHENGVLHGPCTHTFPHSQTVESYYLYNQGQLTKEVLYNISGMPVREEVQLSPKRHAVTLWYVSGTPLSREEYADNELLDGDYYSVDNEIEARVVKGEGVRLKRDAQGQLLYRDDVSEGYITKRESYHANGLPESISYFRYGKLHGEKSLFTDKGEPLATKEYIGGLLHGKATFYENGVKYLEIFYLDGMKNGLEIHYIDGQIVSQEILWENDRRHGPSKYYIDNDAKVEYYYGGEIVSDEKWNELHKADVMIDLISPENRI